MPTLEELRRMLQEGVEAEKPRDIREGRVGWGDDEAPTDHLNDFSDTDEHGGGRGIDPDKMRKARAEASKRPEKGSPPKYTASVDGGDAVLHFGKFRSKTVAYVAGHEPSYLAWMLHEFSALTDIRTRDLMDIVRYQVKRLRDPKARPMPLRDKVPPPAAAPAKVDASRLARSKVDRSKADRFERATPAERLKILFEKKRGDEDGELFFNCPACSGTGERSGIAGQPACEECFGQGRIE